MKLNDDELKELLGAAQSAYDSDFMVSRIETSIAISVLEELIDLRGEVDRLRKQRDHYRRVSKVVDDLKGWLYERGHGGMSDGTKYEITEILKTYDYTPDFCRGGDQ